MHGNNDAWKLADMKAPGKSFANPDHRLRSISLLSQSFNGHLETCDLSIATSKDLCSSLNLDSSNVNQVNQNRAKYHRYASRKDLESLKSGDLEMMLSGLRWILKRITVSPWSDHFGAVLSGTIRHGGVQGPRPGSRDLVGHDARLLKIQSKRENISHGCFHWWNWKNNPNFNSTNGIGM